MESSRSDSSSLQAALLESSITKFGALVSEDGLLQNRREAQRVKEPTVSRLGAEVQDYKLKASSVPELNHL